MFFNFYFFLIFFLTGFKDVNTQKNIKKRFWFVIFAILKSSNLKIVQIWKLFKLKKINFDFFQI
jgi:hypothetical protein